MVGPLVDDKDIKGRRQVQRHLIYFEQVTELRRQSVILITGATGNNGQELIRQLTQMGQRVRALLRKPAEAAKLDGSNLEVVTGDFDLPETLEVALQGTEKAFLLTPGRPEIPGCNSRTTHSSSTGRPRALLLAAMPQWCLWMMAPERQCS